MSLVQDIQVGTGLGSSEIARIAATAPKRYKVYNIPKRSGGVRQIAQPARELKLVQRYLVDSVLSKFPVHKSALAYVEGRNIGQNAAVHQFSRAILKLDFQSFFPSIVVRDWVSFLARNEGLLEATKLADGADRMMITRLLFWGAGTRQPKCLSIGAPSSPIMSNILMYALDTEIAALAFEAGAKYTRYADDITLSADKSSVLVELEQAVRQAVAKVKSPKLAFNEAKRGLYTSGQRRMITGLIITPDKSISLGRERKRMISSLVHRFSLGLLSADETSQAKGFLGFAIANEPAFLDRLRAKYGSDVLDRILKFQIPRRTERR